MTKPKSSVSSIVPSIYAIYLVNGAKLLNYT